MFSLRPSRILMVLETFCQVHLRTLRETEPRCDPSQDVDWLLVT